MHLFWPLWIYVSKLLCCAVLFGDDFGGAHRNTDEQENKHSGWMRMDPVLLGGVLAG